ncbi:hypothetical protein A7U60_g7170 [Sanghuangporus baumii]|uniref:Uncharacterized protein n=1 Tax=Sanghuangporus baumii TaxID=108892 RepID=A0A9Q5N6I6_SANBA|nr:hypothetical protein A7U60_g7170 [Sanghuangporus baumii]
MLRLNTKLTESDPSDVKESEEVYDYVKENVFPHVTADDPAPPSLLIFIARRISHPVLNCDEIPRLLDVLGSLEMVRRVSMEHARLALKLQLKSLESQEPGIVLLKKTDEKKLRNFADEKIVSTLRLVFREDILFNLYRLHICYLWTSPQSNLIMKFMKRYFPSNYARDGDPFAEHIWQDPLYAGFTREERERVYSVGEEMKAFLLRCRAWDLEREDYFRKLGINEDVAFGESEFISYTRDFNAKFRSTIDEGRSMQSLQLYLKKVQTLTDTLEKLFPSAQRKGESAAMVFLARESKMQGPQTR